MFSLPKLPYKYNALEPAIDEQTMRLHHDKHHQHYIDELNEDVAKVPDLADKNLIEIMGSLGNLPDDLRKCIKFNAGGHFNHSCLWLNMTPGGTDLPEDSKLSELIVATYGSLDGLKEELEEEAEELKGAGWVWFYVEMGEGGRLDCDGYPNQENPYMDMSGDCIPLLGIDCWEHSYYLQYHTDKMKYIKNFWKVVNWQRVAETYDAINFNAFPAEV